MAKEFYKHYLAGLQFLHVRLLRNNLEIGHLQDYEVVI